MSYIFGYGSIINSKSRSKTGKTGKCYPAIVTGLQRAWDLPIPGEAVTALGITKKPKIKCNGIVVEIDSNELNNFDKREKGYRRIPVREKNIQGFNPQGKVWVYTNVKTTKPTLNKPIIQSYLDVIIQGCLEYGKQFAIKFVETTTNWNYPWINDRPNPRYPRALENNPKLFKKVDNILKQAIPNQLAKRQTIQF